MRADYNSVSCLKRNKCFEYSGRCRVSRRYNRSDNADRLGDFLNAELLIFLDDTACFGVLVRIVNVLCGVVIFNNFIFYDAHARFLYSHFGKGYARFI